MARSEVRRACEVSIALDFKSTPIAIALRGCDFILFEENTRHTPCDGYYKSTASERATRWLGTFLSASRLNPRSGLQAYYERLRLILGQLN